MMILQSETWQNLNDYHTWNSWMYSVIQDANIEQIHNLMIHTVIHVDHFILYTYTCKLYLLKVYYKAWRNKDIYFYKFISNFYFSKCQRLDLIADTSTYKRIRTSCTCICMYLLLANGWDKISAPRFIRYSTTWYLLCSIANWKAVWPLEFFSIGFAWPGKQQFKI